MLVCYRLSIVRTVLLLSPVCSSPTELKLVYRLREDSAVIPAVRQLCPS